MISLELGLCCYLVEGRLMMVDKNWLMTKSYVYGYGLIADIIN